MIDRDEIMAMARTLGVQEPDVERDYLFGWLLAGLYGESPFADALILKGGNALRKGYFVATRFSGDLDFTSPRAIDAQRLKDTLDDICRMIQARTGVEFDTDRNRLTDQYSLNKDKTVYKYTLYFKDFYQQPRPVTISLRLDVTEFGRLYLPAQHRGLIHPYSDRADCAGEVSVVALEEALADKLKCMLQRRSSYDLFDLVYAIFVNDAIAVDKSQVITTFLRKTIFGGSPRAALRLLLAVPFEVLRLYWEKKIVCAKESLLDFDDAVARFKDEITALFTPLQQYDGGAELAYFPPQLRTPIMEAGKSRTLLRLTYDGVERLVEPYELAYKRRADGIAREYLYVWDRTGGRSGKPGIRSLLSTGITALDATEIVFEPRYEIALAKAGEYGVRSMFQATRFRSRSAVRTYRVQCVGCRRVFERTTTSTVMRAHHNGFGSACHSRRAVRL